MFSETAATRKSIGDVDVVYHAGLYHLFHLVLPNHDYIAHAISENGLNWRRVDNALFIGDPGSWDDLMLWTMHVTKDPHHDGRWRMFYTGISCRDQGRVQRVGMAESDDLFAWKKTDVSWEDMRGRLDPAAVKEARARLTSSASCRIKARQNEQSCFPLEATLPHYEVLDTTERDWISFRDPFYFHDGDSGWLLVAARERDGPILRRGCVALMQETSMNHFESRPPLFAPMHYDDIEVPNLLKLENEYYLLGSLREDAKIRYWHSSEIGSSWRNYADNVLLPRGNYAGRICRDAEGWLLWNFYNTNIEQRTANNVMPPPKRIKRNADGQLQVTTFEGLVQRKEKQIETTCLQPLKNREQARVCDSDTNDLILKSDAGFEGFVFVEDQDSFLLNCRMKLNGGGKCGILSHIDLDSHDGYYISLDLAKGVAEYRCWKTRCDRSGEEMLQFSALQQSYWRTVGMEAVDVRLVSFGSYHELCINDHVILSLVDSEFDRGLLGFYVETAELQISQLSVHQLEPPAQSDSHLTQGPGHLHVH